MNTTPQVYESALERVCASVVAQNAAAVDRDAAFPSASIDALKAEGFLGAMSAAESGGMNLGLAGAAAVIRRVAEECGSTAMVLTMHYCGVAVLEAHAPLEVRREAASGNHLSTLAFSEAGSRSHFWAPVSTASAKNGSVILNARKSFATSASHATAYVWSSKPLAAEGLSTIWLAPASTAGLSVDGPFRGMGLRGNDSSPIAARAVEIPRSAILGEDGHGFEIMMQIVLPVFNVLNAACCNGLMAGALRRAAEHASRTRHDDTASALADLPTIRNYLARAKVKLEQSEALVHETIAALGENRPDAMIKVLACKAGAGESANEVLDLLMRVCGGAAFRGDVGVERYFRDARAAGIMAPTTDVLYDFIGKAVCGMPLF